MNTKFKNKTVLVTGSTGFKGSWLAAWLRTLGAKVIGVARDTPSEPSHFEVAGLAEALEDNRFDIREGDALKRLVLNAQPDFVFHLAAQPLVRQSFLDPVETYQTNVLGTLNLLEALRPLEKPCATVLITSDKCYDNVEWVWGYRETDRLGGPDPYSASKGGAELVIHSHVESFFPKDGNIRIGIGRAGNVIGGGDWAMDRIVPDCVRAWSKGEKVTLRNPQATRPWQHVLEPLSGYLNLAMDLTQDPQLHGEPFNFGPPSGQNHSVENLVTSMSQHWEQVRWQNVSEKEFGAYEAGLLKLNCDKALYKLGWRAIWNFERTVQETINWYRTFYEQPESIPALTNAQILRYQQDAKELGLAWAQ